MVQQTPATAPWQKPEPNAIVLDRLAGVTHGVRGAGAVGSVALRAPDVLPGALAGL